MSKDYANDFPAPPWPNPNDVKLQTLYTPSTKEQLATERDLVDRHVPLGRRGAGSGEEHRLAGTYGATSLHDSHPDDNEQSNGVQFQTLDDAKEHWKQTKDLFEPERLKQVLNDPGNVLTIRDVVQNIPDWKLIDADHHAYARRALPITEQDIKEQEWQGKKHDEDEQTDTNDSNDSEQTKKTGRSKDPKEQDAAGGADEDEAATKEESAFADAVIREMQTIASFGNATGKTKEPLKPLDATLDAWKQLEMRIQVEDQGTPDNWIPRSQQLHRLTGKHPMNAEPDMKALYSAGMITPTKLHYVRSHGAVPCLDWNTHILSVDIDHSLRSDAVYREIPGLRNFEPRKLTMDQLAGEGGMGQQSCGGFEVVELPVTIACTGNRRGEVNSVRRSAGFSWGASGVSTCLWRGVFARDVLRACGLEVGLNHSGRRLYLHFEGAEDLSDGKYATSVPLMHILDPCNDVLFAFGQNGRVLHPDHGFPLRSIIPGFAGGRCIKWLSKVWISDKPSTNHYHIWDNRLLPPQVTDKKTLLARALFHHPDTECNEQALQSVICVPGHGEQILLPKEADNSTYTIRGYAYNGGGTPVNRVEISLDGGATWKYCWREFVDEPLRHGRQCWAWVFWHCDVTYSELVNTKEVIVRAWDAHQTRQPENISWNILGMMNNSWYRVKLGFEPVPGTADLALTARHPVAPGAKEGGWMKAPKEESKNPSGQDVKTFTLEEVAKHDTEKDCWIILEDKVYDVTSVLSWHPGGAKAITTYAGHATVDATTQYASIHDAYANSKRDECFIGVLSAAGVKAMREDGKRAAKELEAVKEKRAGLAVMPDTFCSAKLKSRKEVSNDTRLYTFELPKTDDGKPGKLGLPIGKHVVIAFHFKDQACTRSYTPIKPVLPHEEDGTFDLLVKTYLPTKTFPPGGTMGNFLDVLQVGQEIDVRGPTGEIEYLGHGKFSVDGNEHYFTKINLIAGGTGLTPHWQLIHAILSTADDTTEISLIDSNKSPADILMHEELEKYAAERKGQFKLWHTIGKDSKPDGWKYDARHLDEDMMREHLFPVAADVGAFMCGPPGLISKAAVPGLKAMGFKEGENMFGF